MNQTDKTLSNWKLIQILLPYYKKNKGILIADFICAALTTGCDLVLPLILSRITNTAAANPAALTMSFIGKASAIYIAFRIVEIIARYFMQSTGHIMGALIERDMRASLYGHLQTLSHSYFATHKTGNILANLTSDLFDITEFSHHCPEEYFIGAIKLVISFWILIQVNVTLTIALFALIPIYFFASGYFRKMLRRTQMAQRKQVGRFNSSIEESFLGIFVVKSFHNEEVEGEKFEHDNNRFLEIKKQFYRALAGFQSVSRIFDGLMLTFVLVFGGIFLMQKKITPGDFIAYILYTQTLLTTLSRIIEFTEQFEKGMTGLERFHEAMKVKSDIVDRPNAQELKAVTGEICFDHVSFHYPGSQEMVLEDISIRIPAGKQIALVGPSGGGKTTLSNLVPRFYDVTDGSVQIDGRDVRDVTLASLREHVGTVQQDVYLFSDTVLANIAYGKPDASRKEIEQAARLAGAYDFIMELPHGFDTYVGERGVMLSGGQKQRISIARVFLKNPSILILDEATSALDNQSEYHIQQSLDMLAKNRTTITIAHRLSTIRNADEILVLMDGKIRERGTHQQLMEQKGNYYELYCISEEKQSMDDSMWDERIQ
ncbi:ABC transporter ATP-binding protein [Peptoniphilaceae bacterium SGI.137]